MNPPTMEQNEQPPIETAQSLAAEGDWDSAAAIWWRVAQEAEHTDKPTAALAYSEHGRCMLELGSFDQAQSSLQLAKTIQPDFMLAYRLLGWVAAARGDWRLAAAQWRAVLETEPPAPEQAEALVNLALALMELQDFDGAAAAQERLAAVTDDPHLAREQRALLAEKRGDLKSAVAQWLEIAEDKQDDPAAWTSHARFCLYLGEFGIAKTSLDRAFALQPGFLPARQVLASIATEQRDWPLAAEQWRAILESHTQDSSAPDTALAETLYALIGALIELDKFSEAEPLLKRLTQAQTDPRNALELQAAMAERRGHWDQAGKLWLDIALLSG